MGDTYDQRILIKAARHRREDAEALFANGRWNGAIYVGGYVIECVIKSYLCQVEVKNNFKGTRLYNENNMKGNSLHNLAKFLELSPTLQRVIKYDRTSKYKDAWKVLVTFWLKDDLRYGDKLGDETTTRSFLDAVKLLHEYFLGLMGE